MKKSVNIFAFVSEIISILRKRIYPMLNLDEIAEKGLTVLDKSRHHLFAQAFRDTLQLDGKHLEIKRKHRLGTMPDVWRADQLAEEYNFDLRDLKRLRLCFLRPLAHTFLDGYKPISRPYFLQKYDSKYYVTRFAKSPIFFDKAEKQMILTMAEWLHLADADTEPPIPKIIRKLL